MVIYDCKVNHLTDPLGYELGTPVFSWKVREATGTRQTAARLTLRCGGAPAAGPRPGAPVRRRPPPATPPVPRRPRTREEVGTEFNVTRERIRQIEAKALRKLRHPSRSKKLKDFLN